MVLVVSLNTSLDRILVVDRFVPGEVYRVQGEYLLGGGKALNVLRILSQLGADAQLVGFSGGFTGRKIHEILTAEGLNDRCHWIEIASPSRICDVIVDRVHGRSTVINALGESVDQNAAHELRNMVVDRLRRNPVDRLVLSGSVPPGVPDNFYGELVQEAARQGVPTVVDSSSHALTDAIKARPWMIKVNAKEFLDVGPDVHQFLGMPQNSEAMGAFLPRVEPMAQRLVEKGTLVVVTDGSQGSFAWTPEGRFKIPIDPTPVVNPIGSGDAYLAGLVYGYSRGLGLTESLCWASVSAASNARHVLPRVDSIESLAMAVSEMSIVTK